MKLTDIKSINDNPTDPRLRSESFRQDVRLVFLTWRIDNTMKNFKELDEIIDWTACAHNIRYPTKTAKVEVLRSGLPTGGIITVRLPGRTHSHAKENLDKSRYKFIEWAI